MLAVVGRKFGSIDDLRLEEIPSPPLRSGSIRISVCGAGVSFANLLFIAGKHQNRPSLPFVPGTEIAGHVAQIAPDLRTQLRVGDRVCASVPSGGFAQELVVDTANVFPIPDSLGFAAATWFPTIYATAFAGLAWRANLAAGETLLVHGAAGASGLAAVEIGRALGARVVATAGGVRKVAAAKQYGADQVIDHENTDFCDAVLEMTHGRGADVIYDPVGSDVFDKSLRCMAPFGRILPIGFASGRIPQIPANIVLVKNISNIGLYWGFYMGFGASRVSTDLRTRIRQMFDELFALYIAGKLRAPIDRTFLLSKFAQALQRVQDREAIGKVCLAT